MSEMANSVSVPLGSAAATVRARRAARRPVIADFLELGKARLSALVVVTTMVGFVLGAGGPINWIRLAWTSIGTLLAAFGANAFNQIIEAQRDARMERTRSRPLPAGRLTLGQAIAFAVLAGVAGPMILLLRVNASAALLAGLTLVVYVLIYTPLKTRTAWNTLVGAVVGAIPPLVGWVAAAGRLEFGAWVLAAILFFWQMPHFFALAWLYREDYARGGFRMLPTVGDGRLTFRMITIYAFLLIPLTLTLTIAEIAGLFYAAGALILGLGLVYLAFRLSASGANADARRVFLASVIYLPLLLGLMVFDRTPAPAFRSDMSAYASAPRAAQVSDNAEAGEPVSVIAETGRP